MTDQRGRRPTGTGWPAEAEHPVSDSDQPATPAAPPATASRQRVSNAGAMIGLLLALLGFALVVQLRAHGTDAELAATRPEDLVRILSDLDSQQERLREDIAALEERRRQLATGAVGSDAALAEARRRADELGILAGTLQAEGPGLEITFTRGTERVKAETILDAVQELRGAGAEALQINGANGAMVRVVASTYFVDSGEDLSVSGRTLTGPYTIMAIGEPRTMMTALNIPGGVVDAVRQHGGTVDPRESAVIRVTALHSAGTPQYARPAT